MISKKRFFLASAGELKRERDLAELLIHRKNSHVVNRNMFFEVIRWEELLHTFEMDSVQNRFSSSDGKGDRFIFNLGIL